MQKLRLYTQFDTAGNNFTYYESTEFRWEDKSVKSKRQIAEGINGRKFIQNYNPSLLIYTAEISLLISSFKGYQIIGGGAPAPLTALTFNQFLTNLNKNIYTQISLAFDKYYLTFPFFIQDQTLPDYATWTYDYFEAVFNVLSVPNEIKQDNLGSAQDGQKSTFEIQLAFNVLRGIN